MKTHAEVRRKNKMHQAAYNQLPFCGSASLRATISWLTLCSISCAREFVILTVTILLMLRKVDRVLTA